MSKLSRSSGDFERDKNARQRYLVGSWGTVKLVHQRALSAGLEDPVMLLLDCEDVAGRKMARQFASDAEIEAHIAASLGGRQPGATISWFEPMPFTKARSLFGPMHPATQQIFSKPPEMGEILVVVVTTEGLSMFTVREEASGLEMVQHFAITNKISE